MRTSNHSPAPPVLYNDRVYTTIKTGELICNDAQSGETLWTLKLAPDQIHAAPTRAEGIICTHVRWSCVCGKG